MNPGYQPEYKPQPPGLYKRARKAFKKANPDCHTCTVCGVTKKRYMEIHHIDQNINNNDVSNLEMVCRSCHMEIHA